MGEPADDHLDEPTRKGRSNAILTYEKLEGMSQKITAIYERFEASLDRQRERDRDLADHEARIRELRNEVTAFMAGASQGTHQWSLVWVGVSFIVNLIVSSIAIWVGAFRVH